MWKKAYETGKQKQIGIESDPKSPIRPKRRKDARARRKFQWWLNPGKGAKAPMGELHVTRVLDTP